MKNLNDFRKTVETGVNPRQKFPEERNAFVLFIQHGRLDVTCKPAIVG